MVEADPEHGDEVDGDNESVHRNREYTLTRDGIGLIVFAHGSRVVAANEAVKVVASKAALQAGITAYRTAFLELAAPTLSEAVADLAWEGIRHILVTPYFLTMGRHLVEDLPRLLDVARSEHPDVRLEASLPLDGHPDLAGILADRANATLAGGTRSRSSGDSSAPLGKKES